MKSIKKNKIAIICPYIGELPPNYKFTLYSMSNNINIDWYIFYDDKNIQKLKCSNIFYINTTFNNIKNLIKEKIGTNLQTPYKLCDYKPLYGVIFDNWLSDYEFWGYCDLDMVFGNISHFIKKYKLLTYDKIFDLGHFSLYKNIKDINFSYKDIEKYSNYKLKEILNSNKIYVFDESFDNHISINEILELKKYKVYRERTLFSDTKSNYKNMHSVGRKFQKKEYYLLENGNLFICHLNKEEKEEIIYLHFQKRSFKKYIDGLDYNNYCIFPKGFVFKNEINEKLFYKGFDYQLVKKVKFIIKRWKNKMK